MGGYQLPICMDIFRGRYRDSFDKPIAPSRPARCRTTSSRLPTANHVFLPGHRIMVQIQSSWFPLYDRNPQNFVPNIFFAKPSDYEKATPVDPPRGRERERGLAAAGPLTNAEGPAL
ncbi:MAG: CocE/NonD family hydrolase C-terminal non-catalytic domain-containing protein [Paludibaculum sp.]